MKDMNIYKFKHTGYSMKKLLVLIDGLGDVKYDMFKDKTPLEAADTPNLDSLAKKSRLGFMYSVNENYAPESDTAVFSILGNDFEMSERAEFEALGQEIKIKRGDLVLRANFSTVENMNTKKIIDRRAGRTLTTREAKQLAKDINEKVKLPVKFCFFPTVQHRGLLVFYGGFSDNITNIDTYDHEKGKIFVKDKFDWSIPLDDDENSEYAANLVNSFVDQTFKVINEHHINQIRRKRGLLPANIILVRDPGVEIPFLNKIKNSMAIVNMPLEKGIAKAAGMNVFSFEYPAMKHYDVYENLYEGLNTMISFSVKKIKENKGKYNLCYIHFKETDIPGHDNKPLEKKNLIEILDKKFFGFLKEFAEENNVQVIVTGDHSTVCKMKTHTSDPLPLMFYDSSNDKHDNMEFGETNSRKGSLGKLYGKDVLKKLGFL